jgi:hypothetical protein
MELAPLDWLALALWSAGMVLAGIMIGASIDR